MKGRAWVGTSGWNYRHWSGGVFYPQGLKVAEWLSYYTAQFDTVEINNSFYRLPPKEVFTKWHDEVPQDFIFAVKASRYLTHMKKLADPKKPLSLFLENASGLKEKLGIVLFQLPPFWKFNRERLEEFFKHFRRQKIIPRLRAALEIRNESWKNEECFGILQKYGVSLALTDWPGLRIEEPVTADYVFLRRHGPTGLYASDYPDDALRRDARQMRAWMAGGKDVYIYFNNDVSGYAVKNAQTLKKFLGE